MKCVPDDREISIKPNMPESMQQDWNAITEGKSYITEIGAVTSYLFNAANDRLVGEELPPPQTQNQINLLFSQREDCVPPVLFYLLKLLQETSKRQDTEHITRSYNRDRWMLSIAEGLYRPIPAYYPREVSLALIVMSLRYTNWQALFEATRQAEQINGKYETEKTWYCEQTTSEYNFRYIGKGINLITATATLYSAPQELREEISSFLTWLADYMQKTYGGKYLAASIFLLRLAMVVHAGSGFDELLESQEASAILEWIKKSKAEAGGHQSKTLPHIPESQIVSSLL